MKRKLSEGIVIGADVEVVVLRIEKGTASLGIKAPAEIPIRRNELVSLESSDRRQSACEHEQPER